METKGLTKRVRYVVSLLFLLSKVGQNGAESRLALEKTVGTNGKRSTKWVQYVVSSPFRVSKVGRDGATLDWLRCHKACSGQSMAGEMDAIYGVFIFKVWSRVGGLDKTA